MCLLFVQGYGGGLYIATHGGTATLTNTNVFSNEARVRPALCHIPELYSSAPLERFVCLPSAQSGKGGGLYISINGVANLDGCQVHENLAWVSAHLMPLP